jgi:hypothetical protein
MEMKLSVWERGRYREHSTGWGGAFVVHRALRLYRRGSLYPPIRSVTAPALMGTVEDTL